MTEETIYAFGAYRLAPSRQLLLRGSAPVALGSRAFEVLTALVERPGVVLGKSELIARAWPTTTVEPGNLKTAVSALRRALGDEAGAARYIATVPGRGYRFVAPVSLRRDEAPSLPVAVAEGLRLVELPASGGSPTAVGTVFAEMIARAAYGIVVTGELRLRLGELEVLLRPGSVVARPGCNAPFPGSVEGVCRLIAAPLAPGEAEAGRGLG